MRPKRLVNSIKLDFPSMAGEIAEPRLDMNIKVSAYSVSEKYINILHFCDYLANVIKNRRFASLTSGSEHLLKDVKYVTWHNK